MALTVGSLFAGIGGFDLGFERAGFEIRWQVETDEYARRLNREHWPAVRQCADVRYVHAQRDCWYAPCLGCLEDVDVICGGFPCQSVSLSGKQLAQADERWLWPAYRDVVRALRPRYVVVENVSGLLVQAMGDVLGDLAALGFDAEWDCLPASAFGAYHERDRVFIVAYRPRVDGQSHGVLEAGEEWRASFQSRRLSSMAVAARAERENLRLEREPGLARLVHGLPNQVDRLERLGNAIYPDAAEWIARRILEAEGVNR